MNIIRVLNRLMTAIAGIGASAAAAFAAPQDSAAANPIASFFPLIVIFVIFYFFLIRPQQKKAKEHQKLLDALKKDDRILTSGGIYGTVTAVKGDILEVKIAENVKVQVAKAAVSTVLPQQENASAAPAEAGK